jgi:hypothetical protein
MNVSDDPNTPDGTHIPPAPKHPPLTLVEAQPHTQRIQEAHISLQDYRYSQLVTDGTEAWRIARQNDAVMVADVLELIDLTDWDKYWVKDTVVRICQDLKLKRQVRFLFQASWTIFDHETGIAISDSENPETFWESYAIPPPNINIVRICLSPAIEFPLVWDNKRTLDGQSFRHVTGFNMAEEMFLYLAARELRFLWQWEHLEKRQQVFDLLELDYIEEAELYALRSLSRYRAGKLINKALRPDFQS